MVENKYQYIFKDISKKLKPQSCRFQESFTIDSENRDQPCSSKRLKSIIAALALETYDAITNE